MAPSRQVLPGPPEPTTTARAGEVITVDGTRFELLDEPFLGMTGSSVFDRRSLFWRARARPLGGDGATRYVTWPVRDDATPSERPR